MKRRTFLTIVSAIAIFFGSFAIFFPTWLLQVKGINYNVVSNIWMMEIGLMIIAVGVINYLVRKQEDSTALKAIMIGNVIAQIGLSLIELKAYHFGVITKLYGVLPNLILHPILALGFIYYITKIVRAKATQ